MKRITVALPDDVAGLLDLEDRRSGRSVAKIVRGALASYLRGEGARPTRLPFAAIGRSGCHDTAREAEAILERERGRDTGSTVK